ncbi:uncharacterized protein LOC114351892 isoform X2 [Ostrinia furnacalis]|uniref:uncharacterized protein LOC114351892 isoform X2 n=1 Tax=Ostrinia furnacalis TaxID=93504 RepID=UPI00103CF851|nr:uncharacterized protein LOC114351892 isoform X2 [Ostrinia furnacalis]
MRVTGSRVYSRPPPVPKMPAGLVELMEGLTKDVLKNNPPDVYEFCAEHMRKLLEIRDGPSTKKSLSLERKISKAQEKVRKRAEQRWQKFDELQLQETKIEKNENQTSDQKIPAAIDDNIESIIKPVHHNDLTQASEIEISCEPDSTEKQKLQNDAEPILVVPTVEGENEKVAEPTVEGNQEVKETKSNSHIQLIPVLTDFENTDLSQTQEDDCESNIAAPDSNTKDLQNVKEDKLIENIEVADVNKNAPIVISDVAEVDKHASIVSTDVAEVDKIDPIVASNVTEVDKNAPIATSDVAEVDKHASIASTDVDKNDPIVAANVAEVDKNAPIVTSDVAEVDKHASIVSTDVAEVDKNDPIVAANVAEVDKNAPIVTSDVSEVDKHASIVSTDVAEVDKNIPTVASDVAEVDRNDHIVASVEDVKNDIITVVVEQEKLNESDNLSIPIGNDTDSAFEENDDAIQTDSGISCLDSGKIEEHNLSGTNTNVVPETVPKSTIESDGENIVETDKITDLSLENHIETNYDGKIKSNEKENEVHQGNLRKLDETITSLSDIYSANDTEESTTDLEKVMNEAIENTKRKDSSADDSIKDNIALNDESDASESINLVIHRKTMNNYPDPEAEANILFKNDDSKGTKQSHDIDEAMNNHKTEIIESKRPKRSLDNNASDQNDVDIATHTLNDSISAIVAEDSAKEADTTIDLNKTPKNDNSHTMDLETAAVTIQKVFRNFLFKSRASTFDDSVTEENNLSDDDEKKDEVFLPTNNLNKERRPLGLSRMESVLQTVNEEKSLSLSTDDSSLSSAATIIQAHVRGFLLRNKLHSLKSASRNSLGVSNGPSSKSLDADADQNKNKTVLNIHIVPEGGNYLSRDESILTSMDLSLDGSPPSSVNLHPFGYNTSERRKQLKREDAVQSVSPPSNNSGKLSEDVDSVKEVTINEQDSNANQEQKVSGVSMLKDDSQQDTDIGSLETTPTTSLTVETVVEDQKSSNTDTMNSPEPMTETAENSKKGLIKQSSDEMDVVTPFKENSTIKTVDTNLLHSGEFHDTVLPTKVSRNDTPVASGE